MDFREGKRERRTDVREKHLSVASHVHLTQRAACSLQPRYVPRPTGGQTRGL